MGQRKSGPTIPWPPRESCGPLGLLLLDWMWVQRPPLPVAALAAQIGVDRSTLVMWLTTDRQPHPLQLLALAHVTGLRLPDLALAAQVDDLRVRRQRDFLWSYVCEEITRTSTSGATERADLLARLRAAQRDADPFLLSSDPTDSPSEGAE
jgi:hypothetical protein